VIDVQRIHLRWYAVIFLAVPVLTGLGALVDLLLGGRGAFLEGAAHFLETPLSLLPTMLFLLVFGPLPEELAWRGYALDELQKRHSALASSLIIGTVWTVWHLPLFFISGSYQQSLGLGSSQFWLYNAAMIPESIIITWIFNNNRRSTLSAILFHFMINFTGEMFALTLRAELFTIISWYLLAVAVIALWRPARLVRRPN
jgi:membrane protease YdiL (CAAX protease family)